MSVPRHTGVCIQPLVFAFVTESSLAAAIIVIAIAPHPHGYAWPRRLQAPVFLQELLWVSDKCSWKCPRRKWASSSRTRPWRSVSAGLTRQRMRSWRSRVTSITSGTSVHCTRLYVSDRSLLNDKARTVIHPRKRGFFHLFSV